MAIIYEKGKETVEDDVMAHPCYKMIQDIFGSHLKEIMTIMSYSLFNTGIMLEDVLFINRLLFFV